MVGYSSEFAMYSDYIFYFNGIMGVLLNLLLLVILFKLKKTGRDINIIFALAFIDLTVPIVIISTYIYTAAAGIEPLDHAIPCQALGFTEFMVNILSLLMVSSLAIERCYRISTKVVFLRLRYFSILISFIYFIIFATAAFRLELVKTESNVHCGVLPENSLLSKVVFYYYPSLILALTTILVGCYCVIIDYTAALEYEVSKDCSESNISQHTLKVDPWFRSRIIRKVGLMALTYTLVVVPGTVSLMLEGIYKEGERQYASTFMLFFYSSLCYVNPALVLVTHTAINLKLKDLCLGIKRFISNK